ncbi:hypothetical protein [Candidatus Nephthysia bennettiae]|uniref:Uncharacterized protein n=1 Tax=Candidatus Nephthysia bennettiae TaxID=3127016 RepID=A0A934K357_9BACT|nr:hypothetical protein [Candidatus Dormibacteraeota bacterium]
MLFFVFGSLGSGKSTLLRRLRGDMPDMALVDADVPRAAVSKVERQRQLQERLEAISRGPQADVLYAGQSPLGELLACPVATEFAGIAPCLLDCGDTIRIQRVRSRGWRNDTSELDLLRWAAWMRLHAANPQHDQSVLIEGGAPELRWERWNRWRRGDARWQVTVFDNSYDDEAETIRRFLTWIESRRRLLADGRLPLVAGWDRGPGPAAHS